MVRKLNWFSLVLILVFLVSCSEDGAVVTDPTETGFIFTVDPVAGSAVVTASWGNDLNTLAERALVPGNDLDLASYSFSFLPGNMLEIKASFENVTDDLDFGQPFRFEPSGDNYVSSTEPNVSDDDLGGDGVLSPGETTSELTFKVEHKGETFSYFVTVYADVTEVDDGDGGDGSTVDVIGVVPNDFDADGGEFDITVAPKDADGNLITGGVTLDDFSFTDISITMMDSNPVTDGTAVPIELEIIEAMSEQVSLVLDFDSSGSMEACCGRNDRNRLRVDAGKDLVDLLGADDQAAILDFGAGSSGGLSNSRLLQDFTSDKDVLKAAIDSVTSQFGTPLYGSLIDALNLIDDGDVLNPAIVVLTDGEAGDSGFFGSVISQAQAQNVPIFPIGLGSSLDFSELQDLADQTGGTFGAASDADALDTVFMNIGFGIVEGRVIVTGRVSFGSSLGSSGDYVVSGNLVTDLGGTDVATPFSFPVTITVPTAAAQ